MLSLMGATARVERVAWLRRHKMKRLKARLDLFACTQNPDLPRAFAREASVSCSVRQHIFGFAHFGGRRRDA